MSGNPFRKPAKQEVEAPKPKGKTKKVKFVSPIASPQEPPSYHPRFPTLEELDDAPKSPPPKGLTDEPEAVDTRALLRGDATAGGVIDLKANAREEAAETAQVMPSQPPADFQLGQPPAGRKGPPANPFARTLASIEAEARAGKLNHDATKQKQVMDVDSFKRMLLGDAAEAETPSASTGVGLNEHGSSTDSSAASKPSGSEADKGVRPGSPTFSTSSLEDASEEEQSDLESASESEEEEQEEADTKTPAKLATGPTAGPQTVSFDDFDIEPVQHTHIPAEASISEPPAPQSTERKVSLPPPPPPSTRRAGSTKSPTRTEENATAAVSDGEGGRVAERPKPPPPRAPGSRQSSRDIKGVVSGSDSIRTTSSDTIPTQRSEEVEGAGRASKANKPPPPPSRNAGKQQPGVARQVSSSGSSLAPRRTSPGAAISTPPPPPPRRSTDSKRPSMDSPRTSMAPGDSQSISIEQRPAEEGGAQGGAGTTDMLADLDAFQREVDELRARAFRG